MLPYSFTFYILAKDFYPKTKVGEILGLCFQLVQSTYWIQACPLHARCGSCPTCSRWRRSSAPAWWDRPWGRLCIYRGGGTIASSARIPASRVGDVQIYDDSARKKRDELARIKTDSMASWLAFVLFNRGQFKIRNKISCAYLPCLICFSFKASILIFQVSHLFPVHAELNSCKRGHCNGR